MTETAAPHGPSLEWSANEVVERNQFGDAVLTLRIAANGTVGRFLPYCEAHLTLLDDAFKPLTAKPLASEKDARELIQRVRRT